MSDDQVMLYLFEEFGISDGQQLQRLDKEQRNAILSGISFQIFQKLFWTSRDSGLSLCPKVVYLDATGHVLK